MSQERIDLLEEKITYQEHTINELNEAIVQHQHAIDKLERITAVLIEKLKEVSDGSGGDGGSVVDEKPPHY